MAVGSPSARAASSDGIHNIQHVVVITQENRSFDEYFGTYPGANGIPAGVCMPDPLNGGCIAPYHNAADQNYGGPHGNPAFLADLDGGRMDGFVAQAEQGQGCTSTDPACSPCTVTSVVSVLYQRALAGPHGEVGARKSSGKLPFVSMMTEVAVFGGATGESAPETVAALNAAKLSSRSSTGVCVVTPR